MKTSKSSEALEYKSEKNTQAGGRKKPADNL